MRRFLRSFLASVALAWTASCAPEALPPVGEVRLAVDTDAPVPGVVDRLRLDVYRDDGTWIESREAALESPAAWPATFALARPYDAPGRVDVLVRLRAYADGHVRDYRGERFVPKPPPSTSGSVAAEPAATFEPRLVVRGVDVTPRTEPAPGVTIDRLVLVSVEAGRVGHVRVDLATACAGTMADLAGRRSCVDHEGELVDVARTSLADAPDVAASRVGTFGASAGCAGVARAGRAAADGTPLFDEEVCVPGGAFVFGDASPVPPLGASAAPERVVVIPPLFVDRYEVTVGRWRDRTRRGFRVRERNQLVAHDDTTGTDLGDADRDQTQDSLCTWTPSPRWETHALSCVSHQAARELCAYEGGDLLTEAQWEWVALAAGRPRKTRVPWGDASPDPVPCSHAVFGRWRNGSIAGACFGARAPGDTGFGPLPVDARAATDVTPLGVVGLGGGLQEHVRGSPHPLGSACWLSQPVVDPSCEDPSSSLVMSRGGAFTREAFSLEGTHRDAFAANTYARYTGFRCARRAEAP